MRHSGALQEGWHFSCERGCTRDDNDKAGTFSDERLKMDLPFVNVLCVQTSTQRSAGPLVAHRTARAQWCCTMDGQRRSGQRPAASACAERPDHRTGGVCAPSLAARSCIDIRRWRPGPAQRPPSPQKPCAAVARPRRSKWQVAAEISNGLRVLCGAANTALSGSGRERWPVIGGHQ